MHYIIHFYTLLSSYQLYFSINPNNTERRVVELGEFDKLTFRKLLEQIHAIVFYLMHDLRTLYASLLLLFLYYTAMAMLLETEYDHDLSYEFLQMEIIELKKLHLKLLHEVYRVKLMNSNLQ